MRVLVLYLVALLAVTFCACSDHPGPTVPGTIEEPWTYPDTIFPLSETERVQRLAVFCQQNPDVCVAMDSFGRLTEVSPCQVPAGPYAPDSAAAAGVAEHFLESNRELFNLGSTLPAVVGVRRYADEHWRVHFSLQVVEGSLVYNTSIVVDVAGAVYHAEGGHFSRVRIPSAPNVKVEEARALLPPTINYPCWTPIHAGLLPEAPRVVYPLVFGPHQDPTRLELRTAYRFSYGGGPIHVVEDIFIDVMSGEQIADLPYVIC